MSSSTIMNIDGMGNRHPLVIFAYYAVALLLVIRLAHPIFLLISFFLLFVQRFFVVGIKKSLCALIYSISATLLCILINPLVNHRGVTLLFLIGDIRITKEAVYYGFYMALILLVSLYLFTCFSHDMTSEKIMTLMGQCMPSLCLIFSMVLRLVPKVSRDYRELQAVHGKKIQLLSALTGMEMEDSLERSISMKQRGYGRNRRSSYYERKIVWQDSCFLAVIALVLFFYFQSGGDSVRYFPSVFLPPFTVWRYGVAVSYMAIPILLRGKEEIKWFLWKRKITDSVIQNRKNIQSVLIDGR